MPSTPTFEGVRQTTSSGNGDGPGGPELLDRLVLYPPEDEAFALPIGFTPLSVGRGMHPGHDDSRMSRSHAIVHRDRASGSVELIDCGALHGSIVDARRVDRAFLADGAVVRFGDTVGVFEAGPFVGDPLDASASGATQYLRSLTEQAIADAQPVLILGRSGTGKSHLAHEIGERGRPAGRTIATRCGDDAGDGPAQPTGTGYDAGSRFERLVRSANHGTLVLDAIDHASESEQLLLISLIDSGGLLGATSGDPPVDVRLIAVLDNDAEQQSTGGPQLRADLRYRLGAHTLTITALARRRVDIVPLLTELRRLSHRSFTADALEFVLSRPWPGNVRGLKEAFARIHQPAGERLDRSDLPRDLGARRAPRSRAALTAAGRLNKR